jgi:hypothetical protein
VVSCQGSGTSGGGNDFISCVDVSAGVVWSLAWVEVMGYPKILTFASRLDKIAKLANGDRRESGAPSG